MTENKWGWSADAAVLYGKATLCLKCVNNCPTKNIRYSDGTIQFGDTCIACLKCIYACPAHAINLKKYKWLPLKSGYDLQAIIQNQKLKGNYVTKNTKGYFRTFYKYLHDT